MDEEELWDRLKALELEGRWSEAIDLAETHAELAKRHPGELDQTLLEQHLRLLFWAAGQEARPPFSPEQIDEVVYSWFQRLKKPGNDS